MLTSPKADREISAINPKMNKSSYQVDEDLFVQMHKDKQFSPWHTEDYQRGPYQSYPHELLSSQSRYKQKKSGAFPVPGQLKSKGTYRRRTYAKKSTQKQRPLRTNLISLSLERDTKADIGGIRRRQIQSWKEQPNRVKELKKKLEAKQRSMKVQQMQAYNKTISTCLTQRFTKDLVEDTLLIYPAMPKRQPKVDLNRRKAQQFQISANGFLPNLTISPERSIQRDSNEVSPFASTPQSWKIKGEEIKKKIRYLMLKEKVSGESEGEYGSLIKEFKEVNIKE